MYFNAISALALTALYAQTTYAPLLLAIALVHLELAQQLLPLARLDGYFIVADLIGVPDLFSGWVPSCRASCPAVWPVPGSESSALPPARSSPSGC